jgi:hypothetical protein
MIQKLDLTYSVEEALEYYNTLENKFQKLKWHYYNDHNDPTHIDKKNNVNNFQGWGLQTIYSDLDFPYHPDIDPHDEDPEYFKDTPLIFGFAERVLRLFDEPHRSFLMIDYPKSYIGKWKSGNRLHFNIFVPIKCNKGIQIRSFTDPIQKEIIEEGNVYLITSDNDIEFKNIVETSNVFMFFAVPNKYLNDALSKKGMI